MKNAAERSGTSIRRARPTRAEAGQALDQDFGEQARVAPIRVEVRVENRDLRANGAGREFLKQPGEICRAEPARIRAVNGGEDCGVKHIDIHVQPVTCQFAAADDPRR